MEYVLQFYYVEEKIKSESCKLKVILEIAFLVEKKLFYISFRMYIFSKNDFPCSLLNTLVHLRVASLKINIH